MKKIIIYVVCLLFLTSCSGNNISKYNPEQARDFVVDNNMLYLLEATQFTMKKYDLNSENTELMLYCRL